MGFRINNLKRISCKIYKELIDCLFPMSCISCHGTGSWLCTNCFDRIPIKEKQSCPICGSPNDYGTYCQKCKKHKKLNGIWIAGEYQKKEIAELVKILKYRFAYTVSPILGKYLFIFLQKLQNQNSVEKYICKTLLVPENAILIPVPLHIRRLKWRGFNQAEKILEELNKYLNWPQNNKDLIRIKYKKQQVKLVAKERRENIKNSFAWQGENLQKKNIILVDDISTTGATLEECARILKENGAGEVWGLVIAKN